MANIFYIDDALAGENLNLEKKTLKFLQEQMIGSEITGFGTEKEVFHYFFDFNNPLPDFFILDHNLWWHKDECFQYGYEFRYSYQLMRELNLIRGKILTLPKIIYSDSDMAETNFRSNNISYIKFIPKWGESPWVNLANEVKLSLEPPGGIEQRR